MPSNCACTQCSNDERMHIAPTISPCICARHPQNLNKRGKNYINWKIPYNTINHRSICAMRCIVSWPSLGHLWDTTETSSPAPWHNPCQHPPKLLSHTLSDSSCTKDPSLPHHSCCSITNAWIMPITLAIMHYTSQHSLHTNCLNRSSFCCFFIWKFGRKQ